MIKKIFKETILVLGLSFIFAAGSYALRSNGFPQAGTPIKVRQLPASTTLLNAKQAKAAFECEHNIFLDGRDSLDFAQGHIPGAINIPLHEAAADSSLLDGLPKNKRIVVYCSSSRCNVAGRLAHMLEEKGYTVYEFTGGYAEWVDHGWKTESAQ